MEVIESYQLEDDISIYNFIADKIGDRWATGFGGRDTKGEPATNDEEFMMNVERKMFIFMERVEGEDHVTAVNRFVAMVATKDSSLIYGDIGEWINIHPDKSITITKEPE